MKEITNGSITSPLGFRAGVAASGIKKSGKLDLALIYSDQDCTAAGVFTKNQVAAAPVILDRQTLSNNRQRIRGVVANAGNANACTGDHGLVAALETQQAAAALFDCRPEQFLVLSTGVIGVPLPVRKVKAGLQTAAGEMSPDCGKSAAQAIMTTDTRQKSAAIQLALANRPVTLGGIAKGSGMIHPNMATMLGILTTDAAIPPDALQSLLTEAVNQSFNRISVDGDTSTNDTVLLLANGASGVSVDDDESLAAFGKGLNYLCGELAKMIVLDGEGATKFVQIKVAGAPDEAQARAVAETIATSPLVKTALAGSDPNWGRILAAAGRAGVPFDQNQVALWIGNPDGQPLQLVEQGTPNGYLEQNAAAIFSGTEIEICLDLGLGGAQSIMWTCDLTHDYVSINADYRS
jgi:glutamate N-acetyltransferase/amino-acid N-acetyltransferase